MIHDNFFRLFFSFTGRAIARPLAQSLVLMKVFFGLVPLHVNQAKNADVRVRYWPIAAGHEWQDSAQLFKTDGSQYSAYCL